MMNLLSFPLRLQKTVAAVLFWIACVFQAGAHDPGLSTATVRLQPDRIDVAVVMSIKDAGELVNLVRPTDVTTARPELAALTAKVVEALEIILDNERASVAPEKSGFDVQGNASLHFKVSKRAAGKLQFRSRWLALLPSGHRMFLSIQDTTGNVLAEHLLNANSDSVTIELSSSDTVPTQPAAGNSFVEFLFLGLKHILLGYDHLLFLFSLLIVSRSLPGTLKIITCFTAAHSITLALATFDLVRIPGRLVEPLIAASIVFVAVENLVRGEQPKSRMWLVFAFGLIHGLGFASVLRELGVGTSDIGVAVPLVSFNLGVELGQLLVAAPLVPLIQMFHEHPAFVKRWVPACSTLAALAGAFWLIQRVCFDA